MSEALNTSKLTSSEIRDILGSRRIDDWYAVLLCDELLRREEKISGYHRSFERLIAGLKSERLKEIDASDFQFAKATVHGAIHELKRRRIPLKAWYYSDGTEKGPFDRVDLDSQLENLDPDSAWVWKEGMKNWRKLDDMPHLLKSYFFDQDPLPGHSISAKNTAKPEKAPATRYKADGMNTLLGILQFVAFPFWFILSIVSLVGGFWSVLGPALPFMLALAFFALSIPLGIGLMGGKKWAYQIKLVMSILTVSWFLVRYFVDDASAIWLMMASFEVFILLFLTLNTDKFQQ